MHSTRRFVAILCAGLLVGACANNGTSTTPSPTVTTNPKPGDAIVTIAGLQPQSGASVSHDCIPSYPTPTSTWTQPAGCPTVMVDAVLKPGIVSDIHYQVIACFSTVDTKIDGGCQGVSFEPGKRSVLTPSSLPVGGAKFAISFMIYAPRQDILGPYRLADETYVLPPDALDLKTMPVTYNMM